jgi:phosphate-selective porin OprO/OprP
LEPGIKARRGIFLVSALIYQDFIFFGAHDFFDTGDVVQDGLRSAVVAYRGFDPLWFLIGQQNTSPPLDASTFSSRRVMMEEAMSSGAFGFAPGIPSLGVSTLYRTKHNYLRLGLHSVPAKEIGGDSEGYGVHTRLTYAPIAERTEALHFGVAGYWRKPTVTRGEAGGREQFKARPELRIDDTSFVDTGSIPRIDNYYYGALEFLGVYGPFSFQAEYQRLEVDRYNGPHDQKFRDLSFDGYYVQGSYYLTGESPNYNSRFATLWRVQPFKEFDLETGGWGAFEVAARFSHIDLDDGVNDLAGGGIRGGTGDNITLGLNWYPTALIRFSVNYVHADIDNLSDTGLSEGEVIDGIAFRMQWEF